MCGIFAVYNARKAAELCVMGLHSIQHRARDYAGIVSSDGLRLYRESGEGIARQVFSTKKVMDRLHGKSALGHIRYPTVKDSITMGRLFSKNWWKSAFLFFTGKLKYINTQPIVGKYNGVPIAIAHNGNLTNVDELKALVSSDKILSSMDTEYILRLLEACGTGKIEADLACVFSLLKGSFSLGILLPDRLIAVRDKSGNRPLSIGKSGDSYFVSSETCVFPNMKAGYVCDVEAGTMVSIDKNGMTMIRLSPKVERKCRFEGIYFSHPSSRIFEENVSKFRMKDGRKLEKLFPVVGADIVTPIPDSSNAIAMGYGESGRSGKYFPVIIRNHYVGRTFIAADQAKRNAEIAQKFTFNADDIKGKSIVVIDDSIVRGSTLPKIVDMLRWLGAKEVHVRIGSPPIKHPCCYGVNTPTYGELISAELSPSEIRDVWELIRLSFYPLKFLKNSHRTQSLSVSPA